MQNFFKKKIDTACLITYKPVGMAKKSKGDKTRRKLMKVAFEVISRKGFQAAGLNEILERAGLTKGAIYHHFRDKTALGYAVVEELIGELIGQRWIDPLVAGGAAVAVISGAMRSAIEGMDDRDITRGCPLGNLAAEMSAIDDGFAQRIDAIYQKWRDVLASVFAADDGFTVTGADPQQVATFIVSGLTGCLAQAKVTGRRETLLNGVTQLEFYLNQTSPAPAPESEPEPTYTPSPPPTEMEDYLL
ncbi:MAG: TetR/AcrR family transcriptional regulator [bacterium]|nr:TetR/AcrR family transcriptional regulator [bacterium]